LSSNSTISTREVPALRTACVAAPARHSNAAGARSIASLALRGADCSIRPPDTATRTLGQRSATVSAVWSGSSASRHYLKHPEFLAPVNSENLHKARHLKKSKVIGDMHEYLVATVAGLLQRGVRQGVFRRGVDPVQLSITIAAIGYYYLTNRFTGAIIYQRDLMTAQALEERLAFNLDTILRLVAA
jgi:hypothetical protein